MWLKQQEEKMCDVSSFYTDLKRFFLKILAAYFLLFYCEIYILTNNDNCKCSENSN